MFRMLFCALILATPWATARAETPAFPVPQAQEELKRLLPIAAGFGQGGGLSLDQFRVVASPYGPLDVQVTKADSYEDASDLKNIYLGIAARSVGLAIDDVRGLPDAIGCGSEQCVSDRMAAAAKDSTLLADMARALAGLKNVDVVAVWGQPDCYRINNVFVTPLDVREAVPSEVMGFIPSGTWTSYPNPDEYAKDHDIAMPAVRDLVRVLEANGIKAIRKAGGGCIDIIVDGIGDNVWGILMAPAGCKPPEEGETTRDGFKFAVVRKIGDGFYYYQAT